MILVWNMPKPGKEWGLRFSHGEKSGRTSRKKQDIADYFQAGGDPEKIRGWKYPAMEFSEEFFSGLDRADMIKTELFAGLRQSKTL